MKQELDVDDKLYRMRHSLSHVLAQAVQEYRPGAKLGFGPPIDHGFYYDFLLPEPISGDDLDAIEKIMRRIIKSNQEFTREDLSKDEALARIEAMGEPHKLEYARELIEKAELPSLSFYTNGPFVDMCEGPHVDNTRMLPADGFKLHSVASAYWRGDERNVQLTRIYAFAFANKKELKTYIAKREEAMKNDHRRLGADLDIFHIDDEIGKGLPLWLPHGMVLRQELEKLAEEMEFKYGYERVATPHITKQQLFLTSGHLPYYKEDMYPAMELHEEGGCDHSHDEVEASDEVAGTQAYYLKPMNCPFHHKIFAARPRSYRDLPLRLAEYGSVYRFERSGALQGLTRVRGMTMNDAHIYCTPDQVKDEFKAVMQLHRELYDLFAFSDYYMRVSLRDPENQRGKYVDDPEAWDLTERMVKEAMLELDLPFKEVTGEAAFYGPKVDIQFQTVLEREFTVSTNQLDFAVPNRFKLKYTAATGEEMTPYCIHRAPLGTHERFIAFLIEHFGGAFPTWLAPVQVKILPISEKFLDYAQKLCRDLRADFVRAEVDASNEKINKKIRTHTVRKVPIILVVGAKEQEEGSVTVRRYKVEQQMGMPFAEFQAMLAREIKTRTHVRDWSHILET